MRVLLLSLVALMAASATASAEIKRHCQGLLYASTFEGIRQDGQLLYLPQPKPQAMMRLTGRGYCRNKLKANDCRKKAKSAIIGCVEAIWAKRWYKAVPTDKCTTFDLGGRPPFAKLESWGPSTEIPARHRKKMTGDIKRVIEYTACCVQHPTARSLKTRVFLLTSGEGACYETRQITGAYGSDCAALRRQGLCGKPRRTNPN